ncbi:ATP-binding protein [Leuconostoc citreum]
MQNIADYAAENLKWLQKKGLTLFKPEEVNQKLLEKEKQAQEKATKDFIAVKRRVFDRDSLWPSNRKLTFTFERWLPEKQKNKQLAEKTKQQSIDVFKRLRHENFNVFLHGSAGVGKTAMTLAMVNALERYTDKAVMFVSAIPLRETVMYDFNDKRAKHKLEQLERSMLEADVLIIDDFGSEVGMAGAVRQGNERLQQFYMAVADGRYEVDENDKRTKSTIITSNNTRSELGAMYNDKLISRLVTKKVDNVILFVGLEDIRE